ncbi:MAG: hypothetical protein JW863_07350 [Chitinispirillaceae bacterium]|nr:hypothetical protein [Chitinispirillaceae bacterium]
MRQVIRTVLSLLTIAILSIRCTTGVAGGDPGGSEITNGKVLSMAGVPASNIRVSAYPLGYIAGSWGNSTVITAFTDDTGGFTLDIDSNSLYNIYIADSSSGSGCLVRDVGARQNLGIIHLDSLGTIQGTISIDSAQAAPVLAIYSKGTPLRVNIVSTDGIFKFGLVPSGSYSLSIAKMPPVGCIPGIDCLPGADTSSVEIENITIESGGTTVVDTLLNVQDIGELP